MRITIAAIGKLKPSAERTLFERYSERFAQLAKSLGFEPPRIIEQTESGARRAEERQIDEARFFSSHIDDKTFVIALDERGKPLTSPDFASLFANQRDVGRGSLALLIGGPDGFDPSIRTRADIIISFGAMTIPHQLVRVLLMEQLYRAATILSNHPYHRV